MFLSACGATKTVTPLDNQRLRVDVSAPSSYTRAEAQQAANEKAAKATLENGFDRFLIVSDKSWTETEIYEDQFFDPDPFYYDSHYNRNRFGHYGRYNKS